MKHVKARGHSHFATCTCGGLLSMSAYNTTGRGDSLILIHCVWCERYAYLI